MIKSFKKSKIEKMENDEIQRKKKQQLLYTEIIEAGFDGTLFQEFLEQKKPNGFWFEKKIIEKLLYRRVQY